MNAAEIRKANTITESSPNLAIKQWKQLKMCLYAFEFTLTKLELSTQKVLHLVAIFV